MYTIFGKNNCIWCDRAKKLLADKELPYSFVNIEHNKEGMERFKSLFPNAKTVPKISYDTYDGVSLFKIDSYEDLVESFNEE